MTTGSNARDFASTWGKLERSSLLASAWRLGLAVWVSSSASCLVTERIRFDEANIPAHVSAVSPVEFSRLNPNGDPACSLGIDDKVRKMRFEVRVTDPNEDDELVWRLLINNKIVTRSTTVGGTGKVQRDNVFACVKHSDLTEKCNYVVIAVSRRFKDSDNNLDVEEPGDLGKASFWVLGDALNNPGAEPEDCARVLTPDAGLE